MLMRNCLLVLGLLLLADAVTAQSRVYRCKDASGHWVFQGRKCSDGLIDQQNLPGPGRGDASRIGDSPIPTRCESPPLRFVIADPAFDGTELTLALTRDASGYQLLLKLAGAVAFDSGPVPAQFSGRLGTQGLRFDDGELIAPDFRRGDKEIGFGHARSAALLEMATKSLQFGAEIEPRGYAQSMLSAPLAASHLAALRSDMLRCHLLRERAAKANLQTANAQTSTSQTQGKYQAGKGSRDAQAQGD